ncbi:BlaI/MecI/CopY family transcriptional regulator [Brevibacillus sp. B_LB10_24]|uniref:BlaI/MecI/CopY family transcriptional regulator n=1 Tax=Brevibacillus sp. B_LB10_24 TaxID=3380645 RepID=UPI0038BB9008
MNKIHKMTESEKEIMDVLWTSSQPLTTNEIIQNLTKSKAQTTVITFLARLMEKGIVRAKRISKANYYEPCITKQEYLNAETRQFISDIHNGSVFGLINALCDSGDLTKSDIEEIMERLRKEEW